LLFEIGLKKKLFFMCCIYKISYSKLITGKRVICGNDDSRFQDFAVSLEDTFEPSLPGVSSACALTIISASYLFSVIWNINFRTLEGENDEGNKVNIRVMAKAFLSTKCQTGKEKYPRAPKNSLKDIQGEPVREANKDKESASVRP